MITPEFIKAEIEKDPTAARSEWLGLFREDVTAAFPLELIEVQTGSYLGEDDIIRIEDDYKRS